MLNLQYNFSLFQLIRFFQCMSVNYTPPTWLEGRSGGNGGRTGRRGILNRMFGEEEIVPLRRNPTTPITNLNREQQRRLLISSLQHELRATDRILADQINQIARVNGHSSEDSFNLQSGLNVESIVSNADLSEEDRDLIQGLVIMRDQLHTRMQRVVEAVAVNEESGRAGRTNNVNSPYLPQESEDIIESTNRIYHGFFSRLKLRDILGKFCYAFCCGGESDPGRPFGNPTLADNGGMGYVGGPSPHGIIHRRPV